MSIRIDSEENGFWLTVVDDEDTGKPLDENGHEVSFPTYGYRLRIEDPEHLYELVKSELGPWIDEMRDARADFETQRRYGYNPDEDSGYELSDPKHPTFYERMADRADLDRKAVKEAR